MIYYYYYVCVFYLFVFCNIICIQTSYPKTIQLQRTFNAFQQTVAVLNQIESSFAFERLCLDDRLLQLFEPKLDLVFCIVQFL